MVSTLSCPLCCKEKFSSQESLINHLASLIEDLKNLHCPSCNEKCRDLVDWSSHLAGKCMKRLHFAEEDLEVGQYSVVEDSSKEGELGTETVVEEQVGGEEINSIEYATVSGEPAVSSEDINDTPNMIYYCEGCKVSFTSFKDHLASYHDNEDIVLETAESEEIIVKNQCEEVSTYCDELSSGPPASSHMDECETENYETPEIETCQHTQKQKKNKPAVPTTTKYVVQHGKIRRITEEEAAQIMDESIVVYIHRCSKCNLQFPSLQHFKKHRCCDVERSPTNKSPLKAKPNLKFKCTFCQNIHGSLEAMKDHMKSHVIENETETDQQIEVTLPNVCDICNITFATARQAKLHARVHANGSSKPKKKKNKLSPLPVSSDAETPEQQLLDACSEKKSVSDSDIQCPVCHQIYDKQYEEVHMKSHDGSEQFNCKLCNRRFDSGPCLKLHMKLHSNSSPNNFICTVCKVSFSSDKDLEKHKTKQCQNRVYQCQYCDRMFRKPHEKVKHERIHTGEKPHVCKICGRGFRLGYCLKLHIRTHTGERPYECDICKKKFKSYSVFSHHKKTHSDVRNYKCPFCPKAFKTRVQLSGHRNSHTKPFACPICNRPFASLYAVKGHMVTHGRQNNLQYDCPICKASYARLYALRDHIKEVHVHDSLGNSCSTQKEAVKALISMEGKTEKNRMEEGESAVGFRDEVTDGKRNKEREQLRKKKRSFQNIS